MYDVRFYRDARGRSELLDRIHELDAKADHNKNARIQYRQLMLYIDLLSNNGTRMNEQITKHLEDGIWELRPGDNRVLYFFHHENTFVLLHYFRKRTQKTPQREIERAKAERADYLARQEV